MEITLEEYNKLVKYINHIKYCSIRDAQHQLENRTDKINRMLETIKIRNK
jgi:hypothetical protein